MSSTPCIGLLGSFHHWHAAQFAALPSWETFQQCSLLLAGAGPSLSCFAPESWRVGEYINSRVILFTFLAKRSYVKAMPSLSDHFHRHACLLRQCLRCLPTERHHRKLPQARLTALAVAHQPHQGCHDRYCRLRSVQRPHQRGAGSCIRRAALFHLIVVHDDPCLFIYFSWLWSAMFIRLLNVL